MFCKIYFFENTPKLKNILSDLDSFKENYTIVTNDENNKHILKQYKKNYLDFNEIFLESEITYNIYQNTHEILTKLNNFFKELTFRNCTIFDSLEPLLREEIIFIEKARHILKNENNFIFMFKGYSFAYFHINRLAMDLGYQINHPEKVFQIKGNKTELIEPPKTHYWKSLKKNLLVMKKSGFFKNDVQNIFNNIQKKLVISKYENQSICDFFVTPSSDYILKIIYKILCKFKEERTPYNVVVFDSALSSQLSTDKIRHTNLFDDAYALSSIIEKSDEGQKLLKEIKKIIIQNNLSILYFGKHFNPIIGRIFFSAAIILITDYLFNYNKPKSVVTANDGTLVGNSLILIAKKWKIKSYSIRSVNIIPNPIVHSMFKADKICVYGKQAVDTLKKFGHNPDKIILTGNPGYDYIKTANPDKQRKFLQDNLNIKKGKKLIVVGMGRWYENDEVWISKLINFCNKENFNIIIKVHPIYKNEKRDIHIQKTKIIKKNCPNLKYYITYDIDSSEILPAADLVITDHTNFGIEAALHCKPWITVNFINESSDFLQKIFDYSASIFIEHYAELEKKILEILEEEKHLDLIREKKMKIIEDYNYYNDGNASKRIYNLLIS